MTLIKEMEQRGHSRELTFLRRMNEEAKQYSERKRSHYDSN
jgi:hypothetical protein